MIDYSSIQQGQYNEVDSRLNTSKALIMLFSFDSQQITTMLFFIGLQKTFLILSKCIQIVYKTMKLYARVECMSLMVELWSLAWINVFLVGIDRKFGSMNYEVVPHVFGLLLMYL